MTEFEIAHGRSQNHPGPLEPVEAAPVSTVAQGDAQDELATYSLQPLATAFFTEKGEVAYTGIYDRTLKALEAVKTTRMGISAGSIDLYARPHAPAAGDARGATERHTIEGTISFMRSDAESQVCVCCPPKTGHIFSRGVDWDAWETGAPEHFGRGPDVLVRRYATGINANEGKRVRVTVEVLPDDLAAQRKGDA